MRVAERATLQFSNALELPSFNSLLYTVDVLLPFIDLGFST
jgi:hypothetical protein